MRIFGQFLDITRKKLETKKTEAEKKPQVEERRRHEIPEYEGFIKMKPSVISAIAAAFNFILIYTEYGKKVGKEFMQNDPVIQIDFANLVALVWNATSIGNHRTYTPKVQDQKVDKELIKIKQRLMFCYDVTWNVAEDRYKAKNKTRGFRYV